MTGPAIRFEHVSLVLGGVEVLRDVTFAVAPGTIHCLIGPNGGGKTSLVRSLLGQMPHRGTIAVDWRDGRTIGYVPQQLEFDRTLPLTVADFLAMVCEKRRPAFLGLSRRTRAAAVAALERVGLTNKLRRKLGSLSGGERQRVLFAQALLPPPALLVLDEPMTAIDEAGSELFLGTIKTLATTGVTVLWIAHDLERVRAMADVVTCVNRTVLFSGAPREMLKELDAAALFAGRLGGEAATA